MKSLTLYLALVFLSFTGPDSARAQSTAPVFKVNGALFVQPQDNVGSGIGGDDPDVLFLLKDSPTDSDDILLRIAEADDDVLFKIEQDGDVHAPKIGGTTGAAWDQVFVYGSARRILVGNSPSSRRYKTNISPYTGDVEPLLRTEIKTWNGIGDQADERGIGFIAEEIEAIGLTDLVIYDDEGRPDGLRYRDLHIYLAELMRRQQARLNDLDDRLGQQNAQVAALQDEANRLLDRLAELE